MRLLVGSVFAVASLFAAEPATKTHRDYRLEAEAAYQRKDYVAAKQATLAALTLRPDSPRYLYNLAAYSALTGDSATAFERLRQLAALGVVMPVERDPDFAKLQGTPEFFRVLQQFAQNREPQGAADVFAELPGRTGIIEGIAFRPHTGDLFLGDVHHRCIWRRDRGGRMSRFTVEDEELFGVFGLALDEGRGALWAATTALPEMAGYAPAMKDQTALVEFDLRTSEIRRIVQIPGDGRDHGLSDVVVAPDGTVYATDAKAPVIWQLAPGADDVEKVADSPVFSSLQGMVLENTTLLVADYDNGLFAVDVRTGSITPLSAPKNTTLLGLDGLVRVPGGIVASQNGVEPQRVVHISLAPDFARVTGLTVLAAALPNFTDLTLVTLISDHPTVIAGSGWAGFDPQKARQPSAHTVRLIQVAFP